MSASPSAYLPPPLSPIQRIGVVVLEKDDAILVTECDWNSKGLPGVPIFAEHMTKSECAAALAPFAEVSLAAADIVKVTEFDHLWNKRPARLIVYLLRKAYLTAETLHTGASFLNLSTANLPRVEPAISKLMSARAHAAA